MMVAVVMVMMATMMMMINGSMLKKECIKKRSSVWTMFFGGAVLSERPQLWLSSSQWKADKEGKICE